MTTERPRGVGPLPHRYQPVHDRLAAPDPRFPVDVDRLVEVGVDPRTVDRSETLFALSNGFIGVRGTLEEREPSYRPATLINGFHEKWPILYPESAHAFATVGQTIVSAPDGTTVQLLLDGTAADAADAGAQSERTLVFADAELTRRAVFTAANGNRVELRSTRFVSYVERHLVCLRVELTALDGDVTAELDSTLAVPHIEFDDDGDPRRARHLDDALIPAAPVRTGDRVLLEHRAPMSGITAVSGAHYVVEGDGIEQAAYVGEAFALRAQLRAGASVSLTKFMAYHCATDRDLDDARATVVTTLDAAVAQGYTAVEAAHRTQANALWARADVSFEGDDTALQASRLMVFQLSQLGAQLAGGGIAAKGLSGTGYDGHYFWDTELFVAPFLMHTNPEAARQLIQFRYDLLPSARQRAREMDESGALFAWRTITGEEASAYYPAGTAQYHIDADIAFAVQHYVDITGDAQFLVDRGAEILIETARMWNEMGYFNPRRGGAFCIDEVTGPDEYTACVDNNAYTNLMARRNLRNAAAAVEQVRAADPAKFAALVERIELRDDEPEAWLRAAAAIYVPFDKEEGVYAQDDAFLDLEPWDLANTPIERFPLLRNYHPLKIYRRQVLKQVDLVFATYLLHDEFTTEEKKKIFEYYDPMTTGDSTLSAPVQSIMANEVGYREVAAEYFREGAFVDIVDIAGNLRDGFHIASAGGTWQALVNGFGGLRLHKGVAHFEPLLPPTWTRLQFRVGLQGRDLQVEVTPEATTYTLIEGDALTVFHREQELVVSPGAPVTGDNA
ncbi:MAG: glycoside hydrolase family 65 protein [Acidimicrobiia bacterium]